MIDIIKIFIGGLMTKNKPNDKQNKSGCLTSIIGIFLLIFAINSCTGNDSDKNTSSTSSESSVTVDSEYQDAASFEDNAEIESKREYKREHKNDADTKSTEENHNELEEKENKDKDKEDKKDWHKQYDGTKFNKNVIQIQNANTYITQEPLGDILEDIDSITYSLQHVSISTNFVGINGQSFKAPKGNSYIIASWKIQNTQDIDTVAGGFPDINVLPNDNPFIKQKMFMRDESIDKYINTKEQLEFINRKNGSFPGMSTKNINIAYEIPTNFVRYFVLKDDTGALDFYSDLNSMSFSLGQFDKKDQRNGININVALQKQQES